MTIRTSLFGRWDGASNSVWAESIRMIIGMLIFICYDGVFGVLLSRYSALRKARRSKDSRQCGCLNARDLANEKVGSTQSALVNITKTPRTTLVLSVLQY